MSHHFEHPLIDMTEVTAEIRERCRVVVEMGYFITFTFFYLVHYRYLVHPRLAICGILLRYNLSSYMQPYRQTLYSANTAGLYQQHQHARHETRA